MGRLEKGPSASLFVRYVSHRICSSLTPRIQTLLKPTVGLLLMIRCTSFAEKSDQASRFFVLNRSLRAASPRPSGTGDPFLFLSTGAEAPAYSQSASPRRGRFYSSAIHPASRVPVVSG